MCISNQFWRENRHENVSKLDKIVPTFFFILGRLCVLKCGQVAAPDTADERDRAVAETRRTASGKGSQKKQNSGRSAIHASAFAARRQRMTECRHLMKPALAHTRVQQAKSVTVTPGSAIFSERLLSSRQRRVHGITEYFRTELFFFSSVSNHRDLNKFCCTIQLSVLLGQNFQ